MVETLFTAFLMGCFAQNMHIDNYSGNAWKLAGVGGFEPPQCKDQNLVPYRLATPQYIYSL